MHRTISLALAALLAAGDAAAQDRPSEEALFGAPPAEPAATPPAAAPAGAAPAVEPAGRDDAILGGGRTPAPSGVLTAAQENPLAIGGQAYLRAVAAWNRGQAPSDWPLSSPNLLDLYVDTRPNDRVRAFGLARTSWDPLALPAGTGLAFPSRGPEPRAVLDQLWIQFDLERTLFVTVGKQHVKWGVGRLWNPTDWLHATPRDPLAVFDPRTGSTMVKLHLPWEARGWNLYGVALLDDPAGQGDSASTVGKVAGGARAEVVLGTLEVGADVLARDGQRPRFGFDFSAGIWDLDVHGEVALRTSTDVQRWRDAGAGLPVWLRYVQDDRHGVIPQAVGGVSWSHKYSDEDSITLGGEYFYNGAGYENARIYPWLLFDPSWFPAQATSLAAFAPGKVNDFRSFYAGRHYAGLYVFLPKPGRWNDTNFTLTVLGNVSDGSAIVRFDHSVLVNTYLTVETFLSGNVGKEGGEFRFSLDVPPQALGSVVTPAIRTAPPVLSGGVALRVKL